MRIDAGIVEENHEEVKIRKKKEQFHQLYNVI